VLLGCSGNVICVICRNPEEIPWAETGAEFIVESTGVCCVDDILCTG
jgi:glyceraldehyde-3-phosphate dehydrogenase/erythrose-4-phosphate dehydrogenase